jgi:hypothetical protein
MYLQNDVNLGVPSVVCINKTMSTLVYHQFLVHKWSLQLQQYSSEDDDVLSSMMMLEQNGVEQFLVKYMQERRNPMSIASAIIW